MWLSEDVVQNKPLYAAQLLLLSKVKSGTRSVRSWKTAFMPNNSTRLFIYMENSPEPLPNGFLKCFVIHGCLETF